MADDYFDQFAPADDYFSQFEAADNLPPPSNGQPKDDRNALLRFQDFIVNGPSAVGLKTMVEEPALGLWQSVVGSASQLADVFPSLQTKGKYGEKILQDLSNRQKQNQSRFNASMQHSPYLTAAGGIVGAAPTAIPAFESGAALAQKATKLAPFLQEILGSFAGGGIDKAMQYTPDNETKLNQFTEGGTTAALFDALIQSINPAGRLLSKGKRAATNTLKEYKTTKDLEKSILEGNKQKLSIQEDLSKLPSEAQELFSSVMPTDRSAAKTNLSSSINDYYKTTSKQSRDMYEGFRNSSYGEKRIFDPIMPEFFNKQYSFPGGLSDTTQRMANRIIGKYSAIEKRNPLTGQPEFKVNKQKGAPTVKNYLDLWKHTRDEAAHLKKMSESDKVPYGESQQLIGQSNSLKKLSNDVRDKVLNSLPEKGKKDYQGIQDFWREFVLPFDDKNFLARARNSEITSGNFLKQFDDYGIPGLKKAMLDDPSFAKAVGQHDLLAKKFTNAEQLSKVAKDDIAKTFPKDVQEKANNLLNKWNTQDAMLKDVEIKLRKEGLTKSEIDVKMSRLKKLIAGGAFLIAGQTALHWILGV